VLSTKIYTRYGVVNEILGTLKNFLARPKNVTVAPSTTLLNIDEIKAKFKTRVIKNQFSLLVFSEKGFL
jgi:hypothetical protein